MPCYMLPGWIIGLAHGTKFAKFNLLWFGHCTESFLVDKFFILKESIQHGMSQRHMFHHFVQGLALVRTLCALSRVRKLLHNLLQLLHEMPGHVITVLTLGKLCVTDGALGSDVEFLWLGIMIVPFVFQQLLV